MYLVLQPLKLEELEDTKGDIRIRITKKNRHNDVWFLNNWGLGGGLEMNKENKEIWTKTE